MRVRKHVMSYVEILMRFPQVLKFKFKEFPEDNGDIKPITREMHGRQGTHTNRSQAVEKAMKMKIKKVKPI